MNENSELFRKTARWKGRMVIRRPVDRGTTCFIVMPRIEANEPHLKLLLPLLGVLSTDVVLPSHPVMLCLN